MQTRNEFENMKQDPMQDVKPEQSNESFIKKRGKGNNLTIKGLIIFLMILLLLIPMLFIKGLVLERLQREKDVRQEVSQKWAGRQTLTGPILVIPYKKDAIKNDKGVITGYSLGNLYILPEELNITGTIDPHTRHRSIFDVTVYQSKLSLSGSFAPLDCNVLNIAIEDMYLNDAQLYFGLNDFRGIEEQLNVEWDQKLYELSAGDLNIFHSNSGLTTSLSLDPKDLETTHQFSVNMNLKGSEDIMFVPLGKKNYTRITSPWTNPSFTGNFLPNNPADISDSGFTADWKILNLNRNYPQVWKNTIHNVSDSSYGIKLLQSTDSYAKTERSMKYAILFIALTFALYFFMEILQNNKIHPLQYILVGIALCVFYTLLLSFSEYISFNYAYLVATIATVILITLYTKSAFRKWKIGLIFGAVLTALYSFIFILIQLQDRALLFGSIGLFTLLAISMYYSRKIDWYQHR